MDPTYPMAPPTDPSIQAPMVDALQEGIDEADDPEQERIEKAERDAQAALWKEYDDARKFDKDARAQYAVDRRYAAGTAKLNWAVSTNLIGAFDDILVSFLYARNPDVSVKKSPRLDNTGTAQEDDFAKTMELVVSSLWKAPSTRLKEQVRSQIRSVLSTGIGWLKVILVCNGTNIPQMKTQLNDIRDNLARLESLRLQVTVDADGNQVLPEGAEPSSIEELNAKTQEFHALELSTQKRLEVAIRKGLAVDFVSSEDMQTSLDVRSISDYTSAGWVANQIFRPTESLAAMFPGLEPTDIKAATVYHQRAHKDLENLSDYALMTGLADRGSESQEAEQYVSFKSQGGSASLDDKGPTFGRIVELWKRDDGHIYTMIEGVKKWAKQPYEPDYASTRFYPYFGIAFYPVDGVRHPQSLSWRLMKLQDEYNTVRSALRLTRQRAAPGVLFNATGLEPTEVLKIERSTYQEYTGLKPTQPDQRLQDLFAPKPVELGDIRLYDTQPITADMEKISGVQEALQSSVTTEKTATEAEIQQSGFSARTTADRDVLESMLTDLANYTAELAVQGLDQNDATRIAGAKAFWPHGMAIDDLLTMVEVQIEAGTTGKPKSSGDKAAWGTLLPVLQQSIMQIHQAQIMNDLPLANALTELVKETMQRMGDETDVSRFIPQMPQMPPPIPGMGPPGAVPGLPGAPAVPGAMAPGGAPGAPMGNGEMGPPELGPPPGLQ